MTHWIGFAVEGLVSVLLLLTIIYCVMLNGQLRRLKADEHALKATIAELITATEIAERAIAGLKVTVRECDQNIGDRLRTAERFAADINRQIDAGNVVLNRLAKIVVAARPLTDPQPEEAEPEAPVSETKAMLAAAQAFAERSRARARGLAA
ncbi:DUF6468 domain-containing protein [Rhodoplanes roseus]|uniref:Chemotaxis protein n=1 Tax=Rhodoplanes roseus TaxID=29409 RepID=A0A327L355_9BRAD|nr:DUF6468 domain-containing protein [Rhodoplanes roseus]RAI44931.1 chemotaxis protein [Rhodoplanes roseus]